MAELDDVLSQLGEVEDLDPKTFAESFQESKPDLYQEIYNKGFGQSKLDVSGKLTELETTITDRDSKITDLEKRVKELAEKKPDLSKLEQKYQDSLLELQDQHKAELDKFGLTVSELRGARLSDKRVTFKTSVVNELVAVGVDKDFADVLVAKSDFDARITQDEQSGDITRIGQRDNPELPLPSGKQSLTSVVAKDLFNDVPSKFISDKRTSGANLGDFNSQKPGIVKESDFSEENMDDDQFLKSFSTVQKAQADGRFVQDVSGK